jgi:hypothetical protein
VTAPRCRMSSSCHDHRNSGASPHTNARP